MSFLSELLLRLGKLHERTAETPLFNPVFQLGLEISRRIENGSLTLDQVEEIVATLECQSLQARAVRLNRLVRPVDQTDNLRRIAGHGSSDFETFAARWQHPMLNVVFTAHPTFLLSRDQTAAVAEGASSDGTRTGPVCAAPHGRDTITLDYEHDEAMTAITRGLHARDKLTAELFDFAQMKWPERWREFKPLPFRFASWVGYDMDGAPISDGPHAFDIVLLKRQHASTAMPQAWPVLPRRYLLN